MANYKLSVCIDTALLAQVDRLVAQGVFSSRSALIEDALKSKTKRLRRTRLARECANLDRAEEQSLAEESFGRKVPPDLAY